MQRLRYLLPAALLAVSTAGCGVISVADVAFMALSMPIPSGPEPVELTGYSLEPPKAERSPGLLEQAIPAEEGTVHFTGQVEWSGLRNVHRTAWQSMAAVTDAHLLFLWWSEADGRYEVLIRLPYSEFRHVDLWTPGLGVNIRLCHASDRVQVGDSEVAIDRLTVLRVSGDADKTRELFPLLEERIAGPEEPPPACDDAPGPGQEPPGFGEAEVAAG